MRVRGNQINYSVTPFGDGYKTDFDGLLIINNPENEHRLNKFKRIPIKHLTRIAPQLEAYLIKLYACKTDKDLARACLEKIDGKLYNIMWINRL